MSVHTIRTAIHTVITASYDVTILAAIRNGIPVVRHFASYCDALGNRSSHIGKATRSWDISIIPDRVSHRIKESGCISGKRCRTRQYGCFRFAW